MNAATNVLAFLAVIRAGEGTSGPDGYRTLVGGGTFNSFEDHPDIAVRIKTKEGYITSTAAGAYQIIIRTWEEIESAIDLPDFSPDSQDQAAIWLIGQCGALADAQNGLLASAVEKCNRTWASLPGSPYGQPTRTLAQAQAVFEQAGGVVSTSL